MPNLIQRRRMIYGRRIASGGSPPGSSSPPLASLSASDAGAGTLHVEWTYSGACDNVWIEIEDASSPGWSLWGFEAYATTSHDAAVGHPITYNVRARTRTGAAYSAWSEVDTISVL